jgi:hypothetical protein
MAICGTNVNVQVGSQNDLVIEGHQFTLATEVNEFDVRHLDDLDYGSWAGCSRKGTVDLKTYEKVNVAPGDVANINANIGTDTLAAVNAVCMSAGTDVDAKGVVEFTYRFRLAGNVSW